MSLLLRRAAALRGLWAFVPARRRCSALGAREAAGGGEAVGWPAGRQGLDRVWSSASHEGVARALVGALKFRRLLPVADLMADRIHWLAPAQLLSGERGAGSGGAGATASPGVRPGR